MIKWRITYKNTLIGWIDAGTQEAARKEFQRLNPWHDANEAIVEQE